MRLKVEEHNKPFKPTQFRGTSFVQIRTKLAPLHRSV